jgi:hypothetical protein
MSSEENMNRSESKQKWAKNNPDKVRQSQRKWAKNNPEIKREIKQRTRKKRLSILWALKDKPCKDCNVQYAPYVMQFDHISDNKVSNVSQLESIEAITDEAAKCEVVCANCHATRTWKRRNGCDNL